MEEHTREEISTDSKTETLKVRAHIEDDVWFCTLDPAHDSVYDDIMKIETAFGRTDTENQVISKLVPEPDREEPAPVVGTVEHTDGKLVSIDIDLSDWEDK